MAPPPWGLNPPPEQAPGHCGIGRGVARVGPSYGKIPPLSPSGEFPPLAPAALKKATTWSEDLYLFLESLVTPSPKFKDRWYRRGVLIRLETSDQSLRGRTAVLRTE